jgi:ankyrin repeat protein
MALELPPRPSLEHLRNQAADLFRHARANVPDALQRARVALGKPLEAGAFALHDAQLVVAREYGFRGWAELKHFVELQASPFRATWVGAVLGDDLNRMRDLLRQEPGLANSLHREFEDPFRKKVFPVATLLFAAAGPPQQTVTWEKVQRRINFETVKLLIAAGAEADVYSHHGRPLSWARDRRVVEYLIGHGADVDLWHDNGGSPLNFAVWRNDPERLAMLLELGADPNAADPRSGETPLHTAAQRAPAETIALLIDRGADRGRADREGLTPLQHALRANRPKEIVKLLT